MKIASSEKEVGGCGLQTFYYLGDFIKDLEQLTDDEKQTIENLVLDIIRETGKVVKTRVIEVIRIFLQSGIE